MFYHLLVSVWGGQKLELIGELQIDLRGLIQKGELPKVNEWQNLRCDGRTTGVIRIGLDYLDAGEDEARQAREVARLQTEYSQASTSACVW